MSEFINTADVIGDDEMCDQIIMKTVTEYKENRVTKVGHSAFYGCKSLTTVDVPNATYVGVSAFFGCTSLVDVVLPAATKIDSNAFQGTSSLKKLNLPAAVELGGYLFLGASGVLKELVCPNVAKFGFQSICHSGVEKLDIHVRTSFAASSLSGALKELILRASTVSSLGGAVDMTDNAFIYVPKAIIEDYKVATNWSVYADQFRALEDYTVDGTTTGELDETKI